MVCFQQKFARKSFDGEPHKIVILHTDPPWYQSTSPKNPIALVATFFPFHPITFCPTMFALTSIAKRQSVRAFSASASRWVAVGDKIPSATLFEGSPGNDVNLADETASGKSIIIGVPGAFSPACLASHIPGYFKKLREFNEKGYKSFYIVAVNDAFVTKAWGEALFAHLVGTNQVRFLADPKGEFSKDLDVLFDASKFFGNERSKRYALIVEDGVVKKTFIEPDNTSVDVSSADSVLKEA